MNKETNFKYDVIIIGGFGHVGLPMGIVLADSGFQVALYDIDQSKRDTIKAGEMPFLEHGADPILKRVIENTLHVADSIADVAQSKTIIITIGTPIDEYLNPTTRPILDLAEDISNYLIDGHCIILRSTVFPGTSEFLNKFFKRRGNHIHLANCPERIVQGFAIQELKELPQIVSGFSENAITRSEEIFHQLGVETICVSPREAELAKLFSNAWRYIQFATTNQFYMIATEQGADFDQIYHAMTHNYKRAQSFPRPGFAAGPCLLKDTLQLTASYGNHFELGHAAMMVNEGLPNFIVKRLVNDEKIDLAGTRVGILGMAFKADTDDIRDALSYKLVKVLRFQGALISCSDEYVKDPTFISKEELLSTSSVVIVGVPHSAYKNIELSDDFHLVDLWGIVGKK